MGDLDDHSVIHLTTIGRVTGRQHTIEIWFAAAGETIYLLSGGRDRSDWVRNLIADPRVEVAADGRTRPGWGRVIADADEEATARRLVHAKYQPRSRGDLRSWRDTALPIAVDLDR